MREKLREEDLAWQASYALRESFARSMNSVAVRVTQKVGPVKANFTGQVELTDVVEGYSYRITGKGKGGGIGAMVLQAMGRRIDQLAEYESGR